MSNITSIIEQKKSNFILFQKTVAQNSVPKDFTKFAPLSVVVYLVLYAA
jgi:hypothetical protein